MIYYIYLYSQLFNQFNYLSMVILFGYVNLQSAIDEVEASSFQALDTISLIGRDLQPDPLVVLYSYVRQFSLLFSSNNPYRNSVSCSESIMNSKVKNFIDIHFLTYFYLSEFVTNAMQRYSSGALTFGTYPRHLPSALTLGTLSTCQLIIMEVFYDPFYYSSQIVHLFLMKFRTQELTIHGSIQLSRFTPVPASEFNITLSVYIFSGIRMAWNFIIVIYFI